eukprot:gnl/TRDRNA2_/TRDRNA2_99574_c1_seq1.p1 gnl/TRDRNA2_/TRDRNA2_99574_c1~~gnl/TRDRNA2_/TRDRNA2_99574_c1_seq1.p1  ORF type:complete len:355 (+),score=43.27 gnl/TRDRNA2_/TRDRNA2_99574_c1_seq1:404-1468(+)
MHSRRCTSFSAMLDDVMQEPRLAEALGCALGVTTARQFAAVSKAHSVCMRACLPTLVARQLSKVYVIGGRDEGGMPVDTGERLSLGSCSWEPLQNPMPTPRFLCKAVFMAGMVYVVGGRGVKGSLATCERFDTATGLWEVLPEMSAAHRNFGAAALAGLLFVVSGAGERQQYPTGCECFDPAAPTAWSRLRSTPAVCVVRAVAAVMRQLYVVCKLAGEAYLASCQGWDPRNGKWELMPAMQPELRSGSVSGAAAAANRFYVMGTRVGDIRIFDPINKLWEPPPAPKPENLRPDNVAASIASAAGRLYVVGGIKGRDAGSSCVVCFDPHAQYDQWSLLPSCSACHMDGGVAALLL